MPILVVGLLLGWALTQKQRAGDKRLNPAPRTDTSGRVYYVVEEWNGSAWTEYGRRYLG